MSVVTKEVLQEHLNWWEGQNDNALMCVSYQKPDAKSAEEAGLVKPWMEGSISWVFARSVLHAFKTKDMVPVADALEVVSHQFANQDYVGAGYPTFQLNTGAGCVAAHITEFSRFSGDSVWFELDEPWDYERILALPADITTPYADVTFEAVRMAAERLGGETLLGTLDLGGLGDILSSLRRTDGILYDMVDQPDKVKAALEVIIDIWKTNHDQASALISPANDGLCTGWIGVLSDTTYYPSQCDASALVSPDMFAEFFLPTLAREFTFFERTAYHLDGSGQIPHLDMICAQPTLRAIQWVPEPNVGHGDERYHALYKSIISHGRKIIINQYRGDLDCAKRLFKKFPASSFAITMSCADYDDARRWADLGR